MWVYYLTIHFLRVFVFVIHGTGIMSVFAALNFSQHSVIQVRLRPLSGMILIETLNNMKRDVVMLLDRWFLMIQHLLQRKPPLSKHTLCMTLQEERELVWFARIVPLRENAVATLEVRISNQIIQENLPSHMGSSPRYRCFCSGAIWCVIGIAARISFPGLRYEVRSFAAAPAASRPPAGFVRIVSACFP